MSENISATDRTQLWGRIGKVFSDRPRTAEEAVVEAGLDWDVELRGLAFKNQNDNYSVVKGVYATVRTDTDKPLGVVKSRYVPVNNRTAFQFADNLVDGAGAAFESGWEMNGGKFVGLTMRLPDTITIGGEDSFGKYLMLKTTHDGSGSIQLGVQMMRMACFNQFDMRLRQAKHRWQIRHTSKASHQLAQAREALEIAFVYSSEFELELERLMNSELPNSGRVASVVDEVLEANRIGERARERDVFGILGNLEFSTTIPDEHRNNAYGLLNATTEYYEHMKTYRTPQSQVLVNSTGVAYKIRNELHDRFLVTAA